MVQRARRILVTGAASGIGAASCRALAGPGTAIAVHTRKNRDGAERVAVAVRERGGEAVVLLGDLALADVPARVVGEAVEALGGFGLAYLHMVEGEAGLAEVDPNVPHADILSLRQLWHGAYLANDRYTGELAEEALASGYAQAVSFGKAFIANPDLPARLVQGAPLNTPDTSTFYGGGTKGYTDYPALAA